MLVRNWMRKDPVTIASDLTASLAMELFNQLKEPFLPVVDDHRLRGILARRDMRQAAAFVTATDSIHEINFFNKRLKVKDLMVRKPVTLSIDDTVETALVKGARFGRSFFPVMDGDKLAGTVSDRDIFRTLRQILGVDQKLCAITLADGQLAGETIKDIVLAVYAAQASLHSLFTLVEPDSQKKRLVLRLAASNFEGLKAGLREKGYRIVEALERSSKAA